METSYNPSDNRIFNYDTIKSWQDLTDDEIKQGLHIAKPVFGNLISFEGDPYKIDSLLKNPTECCIAFSMNYFFREGKLIVVDQQRNTSADLYAASNIKEYWYGCTVRLKNFIKNDINYRDFPYSPRYS
jgi:hypothetical protein